MIKFRYKRKEANDGGGKSGTAIQKQKIEGLRDRELLPPKDMLLTGSLAGVRNNTLPRTRPPSACRRDAPESQLISPTTLSLFRVSIIVMKIKISFPLFFIKILLLVNRP